MQQNANAQASGSGKYFGGQHTKSTPVNKQDANILERLNNNLRNNNNSMPSVKPSHHVQNQTTRSVARREEKRLSLGLECSYAEDITSCQENYDARIEGTYNGSSKISGVKVDYGTKASYNYAAAGENENTANFEASVNGVYARSPKDQLQAYASVDYEQNENTQVTTGTAFEQTDNMLYSVGLNYQRQVKSLNIYTHNSYGLNANAEDVVSLSLAGIAKTNTGAYTELVNAIGASKYLQKNQQVYAEISRNSRQFNLANTRGDEASSGYSATVGAVRQLGSGAKIQAEVGYRTQYTESNVELAGYTAAASFEKSLSPKSTYKIYAATDLDESDQLSLQGGRYSVIGSTIDYKLAKKSNIIFTAEAGYLNNLATETTDQTIDISLDYIHSLSRKMDANIYSNWKQVITNAGEETEVGVNEFTIGSSIDWKF